MTMRKIFPAFVKAIDEEQGIVTSIVSVFGNVDFQNDRVLPGAFKTTIDKWDQKGRQNKFLPVVYGHKDDPDFLVGKVLDARETAEGLEVREQYFIHGPRASQKAITTFHRIADGVLDGSSFAYNVRRAKRAADGVQNLIELELIEVGPTIYPANEETRVVGVKADQKGGSGVATDDSAWDGPAVMSAGVNSDDPAAFFRGVSGIEKTVGQPDEAAHWADPHHKAPGRPANEAGLRAARSRLSQTQDLRNPEAARTHLFETHKLPSEVQQASVEPGGTKVGRTLSSMNEEHIRNAYNSLYQVLNSLGAELTSETATATSNGSKTEEPELKVEVRPNEEVAKLLEALDWKDEETV